jgi:dipeptidyl aminopeptidase/acylaminoacyl peptidase
MDKSLKKGSFSLVFSVLFLFFALPLFSQQKTPFTIKDYFDVNSMSVADMTRDGKWLACTVSSGRDRLPRDNSRYGDPTYIAPSRANIVIINTETKKQHPLFSEKQHIRSLSWSPDGRMLAYFIFKEGVFRLSLWYRETEKFEEVDTLKYGDIASNSHLLWSENGENIHFALRAEDWAKKSEDLFAQVTQGPVIIHDTDDPFLKWDELRRMENQKIPVLWNRQEKKIVKVLPETQLLSVRLTDDGKSFIFERDMTEKTNYDVIFGTTNQLEILDLPNGEPRILIEKYEMRRFSWSKDNTMLAYSEKGDVFILSVDEKEPQNLTSPKEKEAKPKAEEDKEAQKEEKQKFSLERFSPDGQQILCTSSRPVPKELESASQVSPPRQYWLIDIHTGDRHMIYEMPEDEETRPSLQVVDWSPDGDVLYFSYSAQDKYDRGLVKLDIKTGNFSDLMRSDHLFQRWQMSEDGQLFIYSDSDGDFPADWYSADKNLSQKTRLTDLNPQLNNCTLSHTELISYRDADGKQLFGVLYYPANYDKGKKYPLITEVYESYFSNGFNAALNIFTSAGYAVLHPSVNLKTGYPGEAWVKGALSAINKVVAMGVADPDCLGIQGTSYGGYAAVLLITQTDRFKAAINNSGKVDMISFYTQSPRLGVRNTHAPEKSQDRIGGTLWEYPERYLSHSAVLFADRIKTPLLCITGDLDPNVEAFQSQEIYYALRRLGKKAVWLRYHDGAHGGPNTAEEREDMYNRMLEWYDKYLKTDSNKTE